MEHLSLKELCNLTGATRRMVQKYESYGLLKASSRNKYGHLLYEVGSVEVVTQIRMMLQMGFTLKQIKQLHGGPKAELIEALRSQIRFVNEEIEEKKNLVERVQKIITEWEKSK